MYEIDYLNPSGSQTPINNTSMARNESTQLQKEDNANERNDEEFGHGGGDGGDDDDFIKVWTAEKMSPKPLDEGDDGDRIVLT